MFSDDPAAIERAAKRVADGIDKIRGVVEVVTVFVSRAMRSASAAQQGLDPDAVASQLEALIAGATPTKIRLSEQLLNVRVRGPTDLRSRAAQLGALTVTTPDGHTVRVSQIAHTSVLAGQRQITRENLAPFVAVTARLEGHDLGSAMKAVRSTVAALKLPTTVRVEYGGLYAEQQKSFRDLSMVFVALLLVTLLLGSCSSASPGRSPPSRPCCCRRHRSWSACGSRISSSIYRP